MYIIWNRLHLRTYLQGCEFSLWNPTSRLLEMCVAIWLNAYLIIKLFSSFLVGRFYFLIISVTTPMTWSIPSEHQQIVRILKGPISFWTQTWSCTCPPGGLSWMQTSVLSVSPVSKPLYIIHRPRWLQSTSSQSCPSGVPSRLTACRISSIAAGRATPDTHSGESLW